MASEIERKFLVLDPVDSWSGEKVATSVAEVDQGYLTPLGAETEVRLRRIREVTKDSAHATTPASKTGPHGINRVWILTVKGPPGKADGSLTREEIEIGLSQEEFESLWPLTLGRRLKKVRSSCSIRTDPDAMLNVTIDDFRERLEGLQMAEVEFESEEEAKAFALPPYFGEEVTEDPRYRNSELASAARPPQGA